MQIFQTVISDVEEKEDLFSCIFLIPPALSSVLIVQAQYLLFFCLIYSFSEMEQI